MKKVLIILILTIGCVIGKSYAIGKKSIEGKWNIVRMDNADVSKFNGFINLHVEQGQFNGSSGCNKFFGGLTIKSKKISFNNPASTRMACADSDLNAFESKLFQILGNIKYYKRKGNQLTLYGEKDTIVLIRG